MILSAALAAAVFYLNLSIQSDMLRSFEEFSDSVNLGYDLLVVSNGGSFTEEEMIPEGYTPAGVFGFSLEKGRATSDSGKKVKFRLISMDRKEAAEEEMFALTSVLSEYDPENPGQILFSAQKAAYYGYRLGDAVTIKVSGEQREYRIAGLFEPLWGLLSSSSYLEAILPSEGGSQFDGMYIDVGNADAEKFAGAIEAESHYDVTVLENELFPENKAANIQTALTIVLLIAAGICIYVIASTTNLILAERLPVIGIFRSIGATRRQTNLALVLENALIGLLAGMIGIPVGELLRRRLSDFYSSFSEISGSGIRGWQIFLSLLFAVALQVTVSLCAAIRINRREIREIIADTGSTAAQVSKTGTAAGCLLIAASFFLHLWNSSYLFSLCALSLLFAVVGAGLLVPLISRWISRIFAPVCGSLFGPAASLGIKETAVNKMNLSSTVLISSVLMLSLMVSMFASSISSYYNLYRTLYPYDIVTRDASLPEENYLFLAEDENVSGISFGYWQWVNTEIDGRCDEAMFAVSGTDGITVFGTPSALKDGQTIVDELWAKRYGFKIGDTVRIADTENETRWDGDLTLQIVGFCDSTALNTHRFSFLLTKSDYLNYISEAPRVVGIFLKEGKNASDVLNSLYAEIRDRTGDSPTLYEKDAYINGKMREALSALNIISAVPVLAVLLSLVGVANNRIIAFNQKRREYAGLYSVAMSRKQLGTMLFFESVGIFLSGCAVGIAAALYCLPLVRDVIYSLILYLKIRIDVPMLLCLPAAMFVLICLACIFPIRKLNRMDIVKEIKYE